MAGIEGYDNHIVSSLRVWTMPYVLLYPTYLVHCSEMFNELSKTDKKIISFKTLGYNILLFLNIGWDVAYFSDGS